jgi:hypothetical protein
MANRHDPRRDPLMVVGFVLPAVVVGNLVLGGGLLGQVFVVVVSEVALCAVGRFPARREAHAGSAE